MVISTMLSLTHLLIALLVVLISYLFYLCILCPLLNPLRVLAGPPITRWFGNHMTAVLDPAISAKAIDILIRRYGRSIRIRGVGPWDDRLLTLDPLSLTHVLKHPDTYQKPWQSRRMISALIGCGTLSAEGIVHKRQRRVVTPAFSVQNLRELVPVVFRKGAELGERWMGLIDLVQQDKDDGVVLDVAHWVSRATFDVIGLAGFDYNFDAIQKESNELFLAYKDMFEVSISQGSLLRTMLGIYLPIIGKIFPDRAERTVQRCLAVINRVAGQLIEEKKQKINQGHQSGKPYAGKDLLTLLLKSNMATDLDPSQRISDVDMLSNINTFMFAGSDTSSLSLAWTLLLLAQHPTIQSRLRTEILSILPSHSQSLNTLTTEEIQTLYEQLAELPFLHNVVRESMRLISPVHSSLRVAMKNDEIPVKYPVKKRDGTIDETRGSVSVKKGSFVHVSIEAFNLDKEVWGEDAWEFNPDRWDSLPERALEQPGLFSSILTFSAGPRSCIGMRFSMIEIKSFIFILLTNLEFIPTEDKIIKANVVLTRPYVSGKYKDGSQLPLRVRRYRPDRETPNQA